MPSKRHPDAGSSAREMPEDDEEQREAKHGGDNLVLGQDGAEDAEGNIEATDQGDGQRGQADLAPVDGRLADWKKLERGQVERDGHPEDEEKGERAEELGQDDVPFADRRGQEHLDGAEFKLLGENAHGDERDLDEQQHPEQRPGEENLHHALLVVIRVMTTQQMKKNDALDQGAAEKDDVGDGGLKVTVEFAFIKGPKSHKIFPLIKRSAIPGSARRRLLRAWP